jgi:hypothetical protein
MKKTIQRIGILLTLLCLIFFLFGSIKSPRVEAQEMPVKINFSVPTVVGIVDPIGDWIKTKVIETLIFVGEKLVEIPNMPPIVPVIHENYGYIIPDSDNPLYGTYSTSMTFKNEKKGKTYIIRYPRMYRVSLESEWQLTPDLQELIEQAIS